MRVLDRNGLNKRKSPVFIQSFEQSNLQRLNRMIGVRLVQLVDANDVLADGSLEYVAPFDRPYDWTASGDPALLARTFGYFATDAGLDEVTRRISAQLVNSDVMEKISRGWATVLSDSIALKPETLAAIREAQKAVTRG